MWLKGSLLVLIGKTQAKGDHHLCFFRSVISGLQVKAPHHRHDIGTCPDITPWPSQDHINSPQGWPRSAISMHPISQVVDLFHRLIQEIIEFPYPYQLIEVITQGPVVLCGMSSVLMVTTVEA